MPHAIVELCKSYEGPDLLQARISMFDTFIRRKKGLGAGCGHPWRATPFA